MDITQLAQAAILGLVEGLTEYLPVSSTGHLILMSDALGFSAVPDKIFEIVIQFGAILAVCWKYRAKLLRVARQLPVERGAQRFCLNILIAFLPAALVGVLAHGYIKQHLFNTHVVALSLIAGGIAILLIERGVRTARVFSVEAFSPRLALVVGLVQALSVIPGVSRSGATIMGALLAGADRKAAAEFSFFLAIPTLLGATVYELYKSHAELSADSWSLIAVGFAAAFASALLVVEYFVGFVSRHGFAPFAWYRIALGALIIVVGRW